MTTATMFAAGAQFFEWEIAPTDETGNPIDPHTFPVSFAAIPTGTAAASTWAGIVAQAVASGIGAWQGPTLAGRWIARILISGPGGGGTLVLAPGTYEMFVQATATPERPVENAGTLIMR